MAATRAGGPSAEVLTLDTSGIFATLDWGDRNHSAARRILEEDQGPYLVPAGIMAEVGYMIERRMGLQALDAFLDDLQSRAFALDCGDQDLPRVRELLGRYADLRLGFADAAVVACAERNGGTVLTFDLRDFSVIAGEGRIRIAPLG
jgi:predicted nucleic acid-binding protein